MSARSAYAPRGFGAAIGAGRIPAPRSPAFPRPGLGPGGAARLNRLKPNLAFGFEGRAMRRIDGANRRG